MQIILNDGTKLDNLSINGNNYISKEKIDADIFKNNLDKITIVDGKDEQVLENQKLVQVVEMNVDGQEWWFCFTEKTKEDVLQERVNELELLILMSEGLI